VKKGSNKTKARIVDGKAAKINRKVRTSLTWRKQKKIPIYSVI